MHSEISNFIPAGTDCNCKKYHITFTCLKSVFPPTHLMLFTMTLASSDLQLVGGKFAGLRDPTVSIMFEPDSLRAYC